MNTNDVMWIKYHNNKFPFFMIQLTKTKKVRISIESLKKELFIKNNEYVDNIAKQIDENIYYYISDEDFKLKGLNEITKLVKKETL